MTFTKKNILDLLRTRAGKPLLVRDILRHFKGGADERRTVKHLLAELVTEGALVRTRGNRYGLPEKMDLETGTFQANPAGYGFVLPEKKGRPDVYIAAASRLDAMNGDTVVVRVSPPAPGRKRAAGKREGVIIRILERAHTRVVGTFERSALRTERYGFVTPADQKLMQDVLIGPEHQGNARPGDIVAAEIITYPLRGRHAEGRIVKVIGRPGDPGIETELIIEQHELPVAFSPAVLKEAAAIPQSVTPSMRRGRVDLRGLPTVTIDGEKARDFDDAISIDAIKGGWRLWVHIADVAHYVREGTLLDQEAYQRGTSVYLPDRAIPMLPESLSNGICSLNPQVDRLTLTCEMDIDANGRITDYDIYESVITSDERMTYTAVRQILIDRDPALRGRYTKIAPKFELMAELMEVLRAKRTRRGSIDFDLPEPQIVLDLQGKMTDIVRAERNMAHQLIEEFMLAANETVAGHIEELGIPLIYRIHEEPADDKMASLAEFLASVGITLPPADKLRPRHIQKAIASARGTALEALVSTVVLRTMKQARYAAENVGHFGLAAESYAHFTSPIRRYPDLMVHRIVKAAGQGLFEVEENVNALAERLPDAATHCSHRERVAMEAERDVVAMLKVIFMQDKVGDVYDGIITGVSNFGFFVQLRDLFIEGLVHVSSLADDYYHYIENRHCLRGERKKRMFRIGDAVRVRVDRVDRDRKRIDFSLID
jgi:ribonuclease R